MKPPGRATPWRAGDSRRSDVIRFHGRGFALVPRMNTDDGGGFGARGFAVVGGDPINGGEQLRESALTEQSSNVAKSVA